MLTAEPRAFAEQNDPGSFLVDYLTRSALAKLLRRSERTLARWECLRIGPPVVKIGRLMHYKKSSVMAWLDKHEQQRRRGQARG